MIVVHQVYNKCTPPLHMGWAPHTVEPTPCEGVVYTCCTFGVQESLPGIQTSNLHFMSRSPGCYLLKQFEDLVKNNISTL
jgi:hypothetical protein